MNTGSTKLLILLIILTIKTGTVFAQCTYSSDFESGTITGWTNQSGISVPTSLTVHSGIYAMELGANGVYSSVISDQNDYGCGTYSFWFYATGIYTDLYFRLHYLNSNNFYQIGLLPNNTDNPSLSLRKKLNGVISVLDNKAPTFATNEWVYVELIHDSLGLFELYINGSLEIQLTDSDLLTPANICLMSWNQSVFIDDFCYETCQSPPDTCFYATDFESGALTDWIIVSGNYAVSTVLPYTGVYSLEGGSNSIESILLSTQSNYCFGKYSFWFYVDGDYIDFSFLFNYQNSDNYYKLFLNPDNTNSPLFGLEKKLGGVVTVMYATFPGFSSYQWIKIDIERESTGLITVFIDDVYQFQITDLSLDYQAKMGFSIVDPKVYIDDFCYKDYGYLVNNRILDNACFVLYPNPCRDKLTVSGVEDHKAIIRNSLGSQVMLTRDEVINTKDLIPGIYQIQINSKNGALQQSKFIKL
jgi:hypothetical protein